MPLVFAAIMPHGGEIIPELADNPNVMSLTRSGMNAISKAFMDASVDTVVVITPHGLIYEGLISVSRVTTATGHLDGPTRARVGASFTVDTVLADNLIHSDTLPFVGLTTADETAFPLDWGALIPLLFTANVMQPSCNVVVLAEDRSLPRDVLVDAGKHIAKVAEASKSRVGLIASCDLGHAHDPDGPYGYHPASSKHDSEFTKLVQESRLSELLTWDDAFLEDAKVDAYWQTLMLLGALGVVPMSVTFHTYEAPTYFGMLTASYSRL